MTKFRLWNSRRLSMTQFGLMVVCFVLIGSVDSIAEKLDKTAQQKFDEAYQLAASGQDIQAVLKYEEALALAPNSFDIQLEYQTALRKIHRFQAAIKSGRRAVEISPEQEVGWLNLGNTFVETGCYSSAFTAYQKRLKLVKDKSMVVSNFLSLGFYQWERGNPQEAIETFKYALTLDPKNGLAMIDLGGAMGSSGDLVGGKEKIKKGLSLLKDAPKLEEYGRTLLKGIEEGKPISPGSDAILGQVIPPSFAELDGANSAASLEIQREVVRVLSIREIGQISMTTPENWAEKLKVGKFVTISWIPDLKEDETVISISFIPPIPQSKFSDCMDAITGGLAKFALEKEIKVQSVDLGSPKLQYARATDKQLVGKTPPSGVYKFVTQGLYLHTSFSCTFTIMTNVENLPLEPVLEVFRSMEYKK